MVLQVHHKSSSSGSSSSFDSCSDLLGSLDYSTLHLAHLEAQHHSDIQAMGGVVRQIEVKQTKVPKNESSVLSSHQQDEEFIKGLTQEESIVCVGACKESMFNTQVHDVEKDVAKSFMADNALNDCGHPSSPIHCSHSIGVSLEKAPPLPKARSYPMDIETAASVGSKRLEILQSAGVTLDDNEHACKSKTHLHSNKSNAVNLSEADYDLQQLENSIKFFDLYKGNSLAAHPLRSMSNRHSRPGLEEVEHIESTEFVHRKQHYARSLSSGVIRRNRKLSGESGYFYEKELKSNGDIQGRDEELLGKTSVKKNRKLQGLEKSVGGRVGLEGEDLGPDELFRYLEALDLDETYVDAQMDIENFNLESRAKFLQDLSGDGTLSSLPSGPQTLHSHCILSAKDIPFVVDWVEVTGAKQRKGGSSVWERMVGVKNHTVYCIKVVSGKREWEVLRRYREFVNFYQQMKHIFDVETSACLPEVEHDSRKVFGSISPNVVEARSFRIEKFVQSLLQAGPPLSASTPFFWFLRPPQGVFGVTGLHEHLMIPASSLQKGANVQLGNLDSPQLQSPPSDIKQKAPQDGHSYTTGKPMSLISKTYQNKSLRHVLYAQHHSCAGCYKHLDLEKGLFQGFARSLGRGKPRFCEYTGQLFCSSCHTNDVAVLPACVLRHWDFTPRRVSHLAKAYLDSIYDQALLCVGSVNPYLYLRVPILSNVKETRTAISKVLSCMSCPSRARIQQTMGSRRYLLENNDFFALRDLEDLSKGAFAVLPGLLIAVLNTLKLHVTKQCSICQDSGEWCGAGILCEDPFHPIFPFDEEIPTTCQTCNAPFHKKCFGKCSSCPSCPKEWVDNKHIRGLGETIGRSC